MPSRVQPTIKQKLAFSQMLRAVEAKKEFSLGEIMLSSGFSKATAINPGKNLVSRPGFQRLLGEISDEMILARVYQVLFGKSNRDALAAADMLLKLKDKYPASKSKVMGLFTTINDLEDEPSVPDN